MKKVISIILACCMILLVFAASANAETVSSNPDATLAAVSDKLDSDVIRCMYYAVDEGRYFEIRYHGVTEDELIAQIKAISYAETSDYDLGEGKALVGLPYSSVVSVAGLDNIDYISLPTGLPYEPPFNNEGGYYIIGTMTDWQLDTNYELTEAYLHDGTYYSWLYMEPDDSFMIVYSPDQKTLDDAVYYPKNGKEFNQNGTIIKEKGFYTFEFRPACDGGITYFEDDPAYWFETSGGKRVQTWYYNCIFCLGYYRAPAEREPVYDNLTAGYYVVGTMNDWKLDGNYKLNSYNALDDITLRMCDSFKVAYTPDGKNITRWYPDGEGNAYNEDVRRIKSDSMFNYIEFSPDGSFEDSWETHYGMIRVMNCTPPSNPEPFLIPTEAPENLIVLDNSDDTLSENVYICCHCTDPVTEDGSDIRAKMERMDNNAYGEHMYRFTVPKGTQSYYFTDGEKRTAEMPFTESVHLYLPGDRNEKGEYLVYDYLWAGGTDPVFTAGSSHTTFDRFYEEYITGSYEGDENDLWSDVFYLYDELFEHHDDSGDTDWVLLHVESFIQSDQIYQDTIGNRVVTKPGLSCPFESGYGIYDVRQDAFMPVHGGMVDQYDGLAEAFDQFGEGELKPMYLYRERLKECYNLSEYDPEHTGGYKQLLGYQELYYHRDGNGDIDWALIQCYTMAEMPIEMTAVVGNRVLHPGTEYYPFSTTYGIYDVKNDKFVDARYTAAYDYDDFVKAFDEIVGSGRGVSLADIDNKGKGRPLGDIDNDYDLTIIDVTMIQRCAAMIMEYPETDDFYVTYDYKGNPHHYSDFNRDGERDIIDATCIQRYLVGMPYPGADKVTNPTATLSFEDINSVYDHPNATVTVTGGTAPYTYRYDIHGSLHGGSNYGDDFGEYVLDTSDSEPGDMDFTTGYIDRATTVIPVESLTYGDTFTLTVTVKDKNGKTSEPVSRRFVNAAS